MMEYCIGVGILIVCVAWAYVGWRLTHVPPRPNVIPTVELLADIGDYLDADASEEGAELRKRLSRDRQRLETFLSMKGGNYIGGEM